MTNKNECNAPRSSFLSNKEKEATEKKYETSKIDDWLDKAAEEEMRRFSRGIYS